MIDQHMQRSLSGQARQVRARLDALLEQIGIAQVTPWLGLCSSTGFFTQPTYVAAAVRATGELGFRRVRMGMDSVGGATVTAPFSWTKRDDVIDAWAKAGVTINTVIGYRQHVINKDRAAWERFVRETMGRYGARIPIWIIDNEPDGNNSPPAEAVAFTAAAARVRDSLGLKGKVWIQSPPVMALDGAPLTYLSAMLDAGLAEHCDVIGMHCYGDQILPTRISKPRKLLDDRGIPLPIGITESGAIAAWAPAGTVDPEDWRAAFYGRMVAACVDAGFAYLTLFDLDRWKQRQAEFRFATFSDDGASYTPVPKIWDAIHRIGHA